MNDDRLIRYLLQDLPGSERLQVEKEYFTDDRVEEQLEALEDELMYDYLQGKLDPARAELFEKRLLPQPRFRERAEFAQLLASRIPHPASRIAHPASPYLRAAVFVLLALCAWLLSDVVRLRKEVQIAKEKLAARKEAPVLPPPAPVLAFLLKPGAQRDGGAGARLIVAAGAAEMQLQLELPAGADPASCSAELLPPTGSAVWNGPVKIVSTPSGKAALVTVPLGKVGENDYQLILYDVRAGADSVEIADYTFTLLKR